MVLQKVITPVKTGVQSIYKALKRLDSGFRRNDGKPRFQTFYEIIKIYWKQGTKIAVEGESISL